MSRSRSTYLEELEEIGATRVPRVRLLGLSIHPFVSLAAMGMATAAFMVMLFAVRTDRFPDSSVWGWVILGVGLAALFGSTGLCLVSGWAMAKALRSSKIRLARLDGATNEEAIRESNRFLWRNVYIRALAYALAAVTLWVALGTQLVFPWGGLFPYLGGIGLLMAINMLTAFCDAGDIWRWVRRRVSGR